MPAIDTDFLNDFNRADRDAAERHMRSWLANRCDLRGETPEAAAEFWNALDRETRTDIVCAFFINIDI